jgi:pimeloyl-ACP methyl ester carboxylesterase/uncharacterized protein YndB with AHSA1/START domain
MPAEPFSASVHIAARPEHVYEYFTRPDAMVRWMGDYAVLDPRPDGEFTVDINGVPVRGRYLELDPPRRLLISWGHAGSEQLPPGSSTLEVTLTAESGGTTVRIVHRDLPEAEARQHAIGWAHFLDRLRQAGSGGDPGADPWSAAANGKQIVGANGVELCVETYGDRESPALLLIAGAACSMDWWRDELCERLAAGGLLVIRYDLRDTGQSTSDPPGAPSYTRGDLVGDAAALLDAVSAPRAHVAGMSMGGGIAQVLALDHPERVATLTLFSTSPVGPGGERAELPPSSDEVRAFFADPLPEPDWNDRDAVIEYIVEGERPFAGSHFDEQELRDLAGRVVDRTRDIAASLQNHWLLDRDEPVRKELSEIAAPTLVVHGTEDPLLPFPHGVALADAIPGARLLALEGVGHEFPPRRVWDDVVAAVLDHARADDR